MYYKPSTGLYSQKETEKSLYNTVQYKKYKETEKPLSLYSTIYKEAKNTQIRKG